MRQLELSQLNAAVLISSYRTAQTTVQPNLCEVVATLMTQSARSTGLSMTSTPRSTSTRRWRLSCSLTTLLSSLRLASLPWAAVVVRSFVLSTSLVAVAPQLCAHVCAGNQLGELDPLCSQAGVVNGVVEVVERVFAFLQRRRVLPNRACRGTQNGLRSSRPCCPSRCRLADFPRRFERVTVELLHTGHHRRRRSEEPDDLEMM